MNSTVKFWLTVHPEHLQIALQSGYIELTDVLELIEINKKSKMKENKIIIEGKEFELPDELVNKIKEELNKPKKLTYEDVAKSLFFGKLGVNYASSRAYEYSCACSSYNDYNNCTSEKQARKLLAINKLMNVAKYLNGSDWKQDWTNTIERKYYIYIAANEDKIKFESSNILLRECTYFKSKELAQEAVSILGEDTIKLALSTDW